MTFIQGSVTDASPGPALYALMAPALTAAGYTLVDTVVISARTHKIWKSAAANNTQGLDWYLDIAYTTAGAGNLWLAPFEYFDPATDLGYRGIFNSSITTIETTYYSRYGATGHALETNWLQSWSTSPALTLTTGVFGYWVSVTGDRVIAMLSNDPTYLLYAGMYAPDPLYAAKAGAAMYPLVMAKMQAVIASSQLTSSPSSGLTRAPRSTSINWSTALAVWPANQQAVTLGQVPAGSVSYPPTAWQVMLVAGSGAAALYGMLIDTAIAAASGGVVRGDTATIGGAAWTFTTLSNGGAMLFKAA